MQGEVQARPRGRQQLEPPPLPQAHLPACGLPALTPAHQTGHFLYWKIVPLPSLAWCQLPPEGGGGEMEAGPVGCSAMPLPFYGPASTSSPACEGRDNAMSFPVFLGSNRPSPDMCSSGLALERGAPRVRALGHLGFSPQRQE